MVSRVFARLMRQRNRFPRWLNGAIDYVADHPEGPLGRLAARRLGIPKDGQTTVVSTVADAPCRLLIAPMNYSGQGRLWAAALEKANSSIAARNMAVDVPGGFSFPADLIVPVANYHNSRAWQVAQRDAVANFTHVLIEAEEPLFGRLFSRDVAREFEWLKTNGIDAAFMCHGTDIRLPSRHRESTEWSPYRDPDMYTARLERLASAHRRMIEGTGAPVFVSTPDLLADMPQAAWCPVAVPLARWAMRPPERVAGAPLRVVHVPTSRHVKGSDLIEPVMKALHDEGVISYHSAQGVDSAMMPALYGSADVVLDQFRLGSYGAAACEAMASGRAVVGHVLPEVRQAVLRLTGLDLPVIEATPASLDELLRRLAETDSEVQTATDEGLGFVRAVHDGAMSASILRSHWLDRASTALR